MCGSMRQLSKPSWRSPMRSTFRVGLAACALLGLVTAHAPAQTTSTTETKTFEIVAVNGNDLVVKLPEGTRELTVPPDFKLTVNGQPMSVLELKPGMTGTATITTKTTLTPVTVTEVKNGTVARVTGSSIVVRTAEGLKGFTQGDVDKRGIKIVRDGKAAQLSEFREGDTLTATIVTAGPPKEVSEREIRAAIDPALPAAVATTGSAAAPEPPPAAAPPQQVASAQLPATAGARSLFALAGLASLGIGIALAARRRRLARE